MKTKKTRNSIKELCKNLEIRLPFFNVKPEQIKGLMTKGVFEERIITAICIPYLEKREQYRRHIPKCKKCRPVYENFLEKISDETSLTQEEIDRNYLEIYERLQR